MRTRILIILGIIGIVAILTIILHTELLGGDATYGQCIISTSGIDGGYSSSDSSVSENQCKEYCVLAGSSESNEIRNVSCKFQTIFGYEWVSSPEEFEDMIDKLSLNPLH